jgi:hypothetical protein
MNILKMIGQKVVNAALPAIKADLKGRAAVLATQPKYSGISGLFLPFLNELIDNWTIKL